ncbi:MAG TPA: ABC transporter substrate-binding protein [Myxococcales bacterium]
MNTRRRFQRLACTALVVLLAGAGCTRTDSKPLPAPKPAMPVPNGPMPDDFWLDGKLPPSARQGTPVQGGTLVVRVSNDPPHLSPHVIDPLDAIATRITQNRIYETLYRIDSNDHPRYQLVPAAAESYEESADHLTFTFKLRKGMRFHDGRPVTAKDLEATLATILDPKSPTTSVRSYYTEVKSFKAVDDLTFKVELKKPYFLFFRQIATTLPIMPKHLIEKGEFRTNPIHRAPVGSGPWKFKSWTAMQEIVLERFEDYWGKKPYLDRIVMRIVPDHTVATQLFERGEFDLMQQIQHSTWVDMIRNPRLVEDYHRIRFFPKNYEWVGWNEQRPFFVDKRVRKAMALLFDRDSFNRSTLYNLERPTACHFYQDGEDCDPSLIPLPYDPDGAMQLLKEAGWEDHDGDGVLDKDGVKFRFTFLMPANSVFLGKLTVVLKEAYRLKGIEMDISKLEWSVFIKRTHDKDYDACSMIWTDMDVQSDPYQVWHSSQVKGGSNWVGFNNQRVDELIENARVEFDAVRRSAMYRELGRILYDEQPYMFVNIRPDLDAVKKRVKGLHPSVNWYNFDDVWIDDKAVASPKP